MKNRGLNRLPILLTLSAAGVFTGGPLLPALAQGLEGKADAFLEHQIDKGATKGWTHVIARFDSELTAAQKRQLHVLHADIYRNLPIIKSVALTVPVRNLKKLADLNFVQRLSADLGVKKCDEFTVESSGAAFAFSRYGVTGDNVRVAVIDSGIHNQSDFGNQQISGFPSPSGGANRLVAQVNFVPDITGRVDPNQTDDKCGHGTHVAGILAGNARNSSTSNCYRHFWGIAPQADLLNVRVLDQNGEGTVSQVISGIQWVLNNQAAYKVRIINLSVGHPVGESYTTDPLCQAVEKAWNSGIVVVCAAGNRGRIQDDADSTLDNEGYGTAYGSIDSPGNDPYVITVGAMKSTDWVFNANGTWTHNRNNDRIATYSSRGPSRLDFVLKPDIVAPGNQVISVDSNNSILDNYSGNTNDVKHNQYILKGDSNWSNTYFRLSGTSMSAPVVAGAAALMLQKDPALTPDTVKARLMLSADKWSQPGGQGDPCTFGAGYLNIPAALACTAVPSQKALSPSMSVDRMGNVYINADRAIWGSDIYGQRAVWGVNSVNDLRAVWGSRAIWGSNILNASRAVWGCNVWTDRAIWGASISAVDLSSTAIKGE